MGLPRSDVTALVSLGEGFDSKTGDVRRESFVRPLGSGIKSVTGLGDGVSEAVIDASTVLMLLVRYTVAAHLALYNFSLKTFTSIGLMELPANMMTPTFSGIPNVDIIVRRRKLWRAEKGMVHFGTDQPAKFLEMRPSKDAQPLAFVGKGITFDSGGISLKPSADMKLMRGDMGGAATVVSSLLAIAQLQLPINIVAVTPLCENLPGPKPLSQAIIYAMNGKSVEVDNTDAEGRLVLADALYYASTEFKPHTVIDVATLTGAMEVSLGEIYTGVFTSEYDRFWRMPLDEDYGPQIYSSNADLCNIGGKPGGSCTAALFLKAFVDGIEAKDGQEPSVRWAHIDIAGTMEFTRPIPYQEKGMTGRPVRALVEFVRRLSSQG
ncbi:hypothetical protein BD769DRAFT_1481710 [Suillus cothurnatus]|nr:hypothetical protein BD769DRAFT_1481710 [Suillus cothurnatus]